VQVKVNGIERIARMVGDGVLVSTAAGSASYARAMGATPLPLNTSALLLVGSNVLRPAFWKPAVLPLDSQIELTTLDVEKRPLQGYIDGVFQGQVRSMRARVSNIAAVELAFEPEFDPATKLAQIQFPPTA
jgi:NAD kinase